MKTRSLEGRGVGLHVKINRMSLLPSSVSNVCLVPLEVLKSEMISPRVIPVLGKTRKVTDNSLTRIAIF